MNVVLALAAAALAAFLIVPGPPRDRVVLRRIGAGGPAAGRSRGRFWQPVAAAGAAAATVVLGLLLDGGRGAAYGAAGVIVAGLALRVGAGTLRRHRAERAAAEVAAGCRALAAELRTGRVPVDALAAAAADHPVLAEADRISRLGGDVAATWRSRARQPGRRGLDDLARGWQLCRETGAPLSTALERIADDLEAGQAIRAMVAGELAAPRASGKIMAALPVLGLGLGYLIGGDPLDFLWREPVGWACLVTGVLLAAIGILWIDALARPADTD